MQQRAPSLIEVIKAAEKNIQNRRDRINGRADMDHVAAMMVMLAACRYYSGEPKRDSYDFPFINSAFRRLALELHPDKNPGNSEAAEAFTLLGEAKQYIETNKDRIPIAEMIKQATAELQSQQAGGQKAQRRETQRREAERQEAQKREAERQEAQRREAERQEAQRQEAKRREAQRQDPEWQRKEEESKKSVQTCLGDYVKTKEALKNAVVYQASRVLGYKIDFEQLLKAVKGEAAYQLYFGERVVEKKLKSTLGSLGILEEACHRDLAEGAFSRIFPLQKMIKAGCVFVSPDNEQSKAWLEQYFVVNKMISVLEDSSLTAIEKLQEVELNKPLIDKKNNVIEAQKLSEKVSVNQLQWAVSITEDALEKIQQVIMDKINKKLDLNPPMIFDKRFSLTEKQTKKLGSEWNITDPENEKASHWIKDYCIMRDSLKILTEDEKSSPDSKLKKFSQKIIENKAQLVQKREPGVLGWLKSLMAGKYGLKELGNHFVTSANKMGLGLERKKPVAEEKSSSPKPGRP